MVRRQSVVAGLTALAVVGVGGWASALSRPGPGVTSRVSVSSTGRQANGGSSFSSPPVTSAHGRFVAFESAASNLVPGDSNDAADVFVRDRLAGVTRRVSVSSAGRQGNSYSTYPAISGDGRFVAFTSNASNLVPGDTNGTSDVFVHDRLTGVTQRVSVGAAGQGNASSEFPVISADGRYVAFRSDAGNLVQGDTNGWPDVFVRDLLEGVTRLVSVGAAGQANADSFAAAISADGRYIEFDSPASNLVPADTNGSYDVFVRDRLAGVTRRVSLGAGGEANANSWGQAMSAHGRFIAFLSDASNLVPGDTNETTDVFVRDLLAGVTRRVSLASNGRQGNGDSSAGGYPPTISADGRYVAFTSVASNLVPGDTNRAADVFVRDRLVGVTRRVSVASTGRQGNDRSVAPAITADGRSVAFVSDAFNLVPRDTNKMTDVLVQDPLLGGGTTRLAQKSEPSP